MRDVRRWGCLVLITAGIGAGWYVGKDYVRAHPEQFPWTALDLADPVGPFTRMKLAGLDDAQARCRALVADAQAGWTVADPVRVGEEACAFDDGIFLGKSAPEAIGFTPPLTTACPVAAALHLWLRDSVQPAARRALGTRVARIETFGSYNCRRRYNRPDAPWSEHATGDAVDISAFVLADGRRISVLRDWRGEGAEAAFLRSARDGACDVYSTVLSPDYNAAHGDHLHLDMARSGAKGWKLCR